MMRSFIKLLGFLIGGFLVLAFIALAWIYFTTEARINKFYDVPESSLEIPAEAELGDRMYPLVVVDLCRDCHGQDLAGQILEDDLLVGRLVSTNLTAGQGGIGNVYTPEDWYRALYHGIGRDKRTLIAMPSNDLRSLSEKDMGTIISIIKKTPPVDNVLPEARLGPMGRFFLLQNQPILTAEFIDHDQEPMASSPEPAVNAEYGEYLAKMCAFCHGHDYSGSAEPGAGLNLTPGGNLAHWTEADFIKTLRTGVTPEEDVLDQDLMPIRIFAKLTDDEMKAIWLFLKTLPPVFTPTPIPTR
jgi:cytochrome c553